MSPLQQFVDQFTAQAQTLYAEARELAREELAMELNLSVRCLRRSTTLEELAATLADTAAHFAGGAIVFRVADRVAKSEKMDLAISLASAPALASAVETRDPVTAIATSGEVSVLLAERLGHAPEDRAYIYPIVVKDGVPAILYAWGDAQAPAVELLVQVTAATWLGMQRAAPAVQLTNIAPVPVAAPRRPKGRHQVGIAAGGGAESASAGSAAGAGASGGDAAGPRHGRAGGTGAEQFV